MTNQIIIPQEEQPTPMQAGDSIEEVAKRLYPENWESIMEGQHDSNSYERTAFIKGAKWQQERMYSEEDLKHAFFSGCQSERQIKPRVKCWEEFIEQFKKK